MELERNNGFIKVLITNGNDVMYLGEYSVQCIDDVGLCEDTDIVILGLSRRFHRAIMEKLTSAL